MTHEMMRDISQILGVEIKSIQQMPEEILGSMQTVLENIEVRTDEDRQMLYEDLDRYWIKGSVLTMLVEVSKNTGIPYDTLKNFDFDTQQDIVFEYMADSSNIERIYAVTNKALSFIELGKISKLIDVPENELHELSDSVKEQICGMYFMEYEEDGDNSALVASLTEVICHE